MKREDVYLEVLSEKTGEPPERLTLALQRVKNRLHDDLSDELGTPHAAHLRDRLRKMPVSKIIGMQEVLTYLSYESQFQDRR